MRVTAKRFVIPLYCLQSATQLIPSNAAFQSDLQPCRALLRAELRRRSTPRYHGILAELRLAENLYLGTTAYPTFVSEQDIKEHYKLIIDDVAST